MVKTRKGRKRPSPEPVKEVDSDIEEKKAKLSSTCASSEKISKYFANASNYGNSTSKHNEETSDLSNSGDDLVVFKKSKGTLKMKSESDTDESSSDEFMKVPFSLDDLGDFESLNKKSDNVVKGNEVKLEKNNVLLKLNDDSGDNTNIAEQDYYDFSQIIQSQELLINTKKDLEQKANKSEKSRSNMIHNKKIKKIPGKVVKDESDKSIILKPVDEQLDISELLSKAEGSVHRQSDDDDNKVAEAEKKYSVPEEGVQITIELPNMKQKRKSKEFDVEAAMKRRINLIRKENQVFMHKVHTLCWIAHGFYLNCIINSDDLMGLALSLIPSKHCYPSKHADLRYLEKLVEWFIGKVTLNKDHKLALNSSKLPLKEILETEINLKAAFSKRDLVLIFVSMVRSLGIDTRLIVSLRPVSLRPPASDLCSLRNIKTENSNNETTRKQSSTYSSLDGKADGKSKAKLKNSVNVNEQSNFTGDNKTSKQPQSNISNRTVRTKNKSVGDNNSISVNKQSSEIKSPYFSSSDDIPLKEIQSKCKLRKQSSSASTNPSNCIKHLSQQKRPSIASQNKDVKTTSDSKLHNIRNAMDSKSLGHAENEKSSNFKSVKQNPRKCTNRESNNVTANSNNVIQTKDIAKRETKLAKTRKSVPTSYQDQNTSTSSEDEVEIPKHKLKKQNISGKRGRTINIQNKKLSTEDNDFELKKTTSKKKSIDRRVLSSDDEADDKSKKNGDDFWPEVFLEAEEKWISVDLTKGKVHCIHNLYHRATQPVRYIIAFNSDGSAKDLTRRYAPHWLTVTRRLRAEDSWCRATMAPYTPHQTIREKDEDADLDRQLHDKPLPTGISEYKNHPLYALRRHLLKFEAIYPADAPPLGFVKGEPVYSRGCVTDLHTRETWIKEAKLVRRGEEPYKIVKARPKWDKVSQKVINDLPLPLFGHWQVEDYIPPPAVDGKVPRNEYGNVELYKPCMLPPGTVHLQVPQLARVARKLGIDCAPAVVGWEFSGGGSHPVLDGFIVCEEVQEVLLDAWNKEKDESAKRAKEKVEQRVYGNWKRLIRGLLIRERLKLRYDFGAPEPPEKKKKKQQSKPGTSKQK